ncbi:hypothetical protein PLANPX_0053 [Lacipirellula parvula]|uniref:Uncharacterized protein n=1 Tax=Lacipirellula parvula TaxID=2650471 RepID=A0A5K7X6T8_9BACT|nr:hypothetical protein PLANPX_0053 [Lacipirellula parvula]
MVSWVIAQEAAGGDDFRVSTGLRGRWSPCCGSLKPTG